MQDENAMHKLEATLMRQDAHTEISFVQSLTSLGTLWGATIGSTIWALGLLGKLLSV